MKKMRGTPRRLRFSTRVMISLLAAYLLMAVMFGGLAFFSTRESSERRVSEEVDHALDHTRGRLETLIKQTETVYIRLLFENELYDLLMDFDPSTDSIPWLSAKVRPILSRALLNLDGIDSVQVFSDSYVLFTTNTTYTSILNVNASPNYRRARESRKAFWTPLYDFVLEYGHKKLEDKSLPIPNRNLVSYVGRFNAFKIENSVMEIWPASREKPVVFVNLSEERLRELLADAAGSRDGAAFIVDGEGGYVTHTDPSRLFSSMDPAVFAQLRDADGDTGAFHAGLDGQDSILHYARLSNGWTLAVALPWQAVYADVYSAIRTTLIGMLLITLVLSVVMAVLVSNHLSRPLRQLLQVINITGGGNFNVHLPRSGDEFDEVNTAFNRMARRIDTLIHENYEGKVKERENELRALKYQTKPHFLYNALTIIRSRALKNDDAQTAQMIQRLSNVLRYVLRGDQMIATVRDELNNVRDYVELMRVGYENAFDMEVDVEPGALNAAICKMTLQPLVENCVQHGLTARQEGGLVRITGHIIEGRLTLTVSDNGRGWPEGFQIDDREHATESIGLANVRRRMKLTFGDDCDMRLFTPQSGGAGVELIFPYRFGLARGGEIEE